MPASDSPAGSQKSSGSEKVPRTADVPRGANDGGREGTMQKLGRPSAANEGARQLAALEEAMRALALEAKAGHLEDEMVPVKADMLEGIPVLRQDHLPRIDLPKFSGDPSDWPSFASRFERRLSGWQEDATRYAYLQQCFAGYLPALQSTESFERAGMPFDEAWARLQERFYKKRVAFLGHFRSILEAPRPTSASSNGLTRLIDVVETAITSVRQVAGKVNEAPSALEDGGVPNALLDARPKTYGSRGAFPMRSVRKDSPTPIRSTNGSPSGASCECYHFEVVEDQSTEAFISGLMRFSSLRGKPDTIHCDNGRNFVGAAKELQRIRDAFKDPQFQDRIVDQAAEEGIHFSFIPPRSPNFGGLWEANIKVAKRLLRAAAHGAQLRLVEMQTLMHQIAATLNSRPLTAVRTAPEDVEALTPAHFSICRASFCTPAMLTDNDKEPIHTRSEYLAQLRCSIKWTQRAPNAKEGQIVLIGDDNLPVSRWPLGIIVQVHSGPDGAIRVANVKTSSGVYRRNVRLLSSHRSWS
uniref:Uncharacterized protein n=1 Tax=Anopheles albimanus TaxID=7167 RepID=A0A182FC45_ANOAL